MNITVEITYDTNYAKEISNSINVDNIDIPKGMNIDISHKENKIIIKISMEITEPRNVLTLRNTVDEILQHISTIEKTLTKLSP
ncbi:KEOPS complex subunit Pcc1 [Sulfurisphaera ohwakuensis]|uniref:KEOPS complex subunit Pcc1 n=1 Tax=Sulfurisphaera ohwakuensis TaxID=69656 RepID=A0A650CJN6_SULOH|nr:KEOPS complex subunit Pcc1 [Sulfurisphaera ohwakuensis]MBB5254015.1 hypothetical protein [Sulfurisphaera ohwakuensis]QGR17895.1 hypothetical protein D1869_12455 [Sulfurisphaera ohwakuensis]